MPNPSWKKFVFVSAMAVFAMPIKTATAAITISCSQGINFGTILPNCTGSITSRATVASGTNNNGCHTLIAGVIRPGICKIQTTILPTAVMNARITFTAPSLAFNNTTAMGLVTLDNYRIQTAGGSQINTHTFNSTLINPSHIFKVGGRLRFDNAETRGTYNNNLGIVITEIP